MNSHFMIRYVSRVVVNAVEEGSCLQEELIPLGCAKSVLVVVGVYDVDMLVCVEYGNIKDDEGDSSIHI